MFRTVASSTIVVFLFAGTALTSTGCRYCSNCYDAGGPVYIGGVPTVAHDRQRAGSLFAPAGGAVQGPMVVDSGSFLPQDGMVVGASSTDASQSFLVDQGPLGETIDLGMDRLTFDQTPREGEIRIISDEVTVPAAIPSTPASEADSAPETISTPVPRPITASSPVPSTATATAPGAWSSVPETPPSQQAEEGPVLALESEDAPALLR